LTPASAKLGQNPEDETTTEKISSGIGNIASKISEGASNIKQAIFGSNEKKKTGSKKLKHSHGKGEIHQDKIEEKRNL